MSSTSHNTTPVKNDSKNLKRLIIGAIGVVYGDIGTSPLYAFKESVASTGSPSESHIMGILSLIFWSVVISVTIKYVILMMRADNKGEGGSLSLFALASRFSRDSVWISAVIPFLGIFGAALFYGDSIITPAISVLSAVEGLEIASPQLSPYVMPITMLLLAFLFSFQKMGTANVGKLFGPIMCIWFITISILGLVNIFATPSVLAAINPWHAVSFFIENKAQGFFTLGSIVLAMTGAEALYADMGHFGKTPIRLAWTSLVFPALILNYYGQGAFIMGNPEGVENPFYLMAPDWMNWPLLVLASMATIIASQSVITGAFSMTQQAIQLGYLPRMTVIHTSDDQIGQIYLPFINWVLLFFVLVLVLTFHSSSNLAHAYGVAVTGTMLISTILLSIVAIKMWKWKPALVIPVMGTFLIVDAAFFLSTTVKIPHGGWFPLVLGGCILFILMTWKTGRALVLDKMRTLTMPVDVFFRDYCDGFPRVEGTAIYMFNLNEGIPLPLLMNLKHNKVLHERNIFLHVSIEEKSYVNESDRIKVIDLGQEFYRVIIRYGFMDEINVPEVLADVGALGFKIEQDETTYFIGRETVVPTDIPGMAIWREHVFAWLSRNAGSVVDFYKLPSKRVMELGSRIDI